MRPSSPLVLPLVFLGCTPGADAPTADPTAAHLVDHERWAPGLADPFPEHQPDTIDCPPDGHTLETLGLEVDTARCNYLLVTQPSAGAIEAGDTIVIEAYHDPLAAPEPAHGHVALAIGDDVVWDVEVEIPADAAPFGVHVTAEHDVPAGTPIVLHLHNHGYNTWTLVDVRVDPLPEND